jgi:hypothetical protein
MRRQVLMAVDAQPLDGALSVEALPVRLALRSAVARLMDAVGVITGRDPCGTLLTRDLARENSRIMPLSPAISVSIPVRASESVPLLRI